MTRVPTARQLQLRAALPLHLPAHEAGHAVMAHHVGYTGIHVVSAGGADVAVNVDSAEPPSPHLDAYLKLTAAGAAAEQVLCGAQLTDQLQLKREDFSLHQDVVKFLVAWQGGKLLYSATPQQAINLDALWMTYQGMAFRRDWTRQLNGCVTLFQGSLSAPLARTRTFLAQLGTATTPKLIASAELLPYLT